MKTGTNLFEGKQPAADCHVKAPRRKKQSSELNPKIIRLASQPREFRGNPRRSSGILDAFVELLELMSVETSADLRGTEPRA